MPTCRYCHAEISRQDKDICPRCGGVNPLPSNYETKDITQTFGSFEGSELYKSRSKKTAAALMMTLGYFGIHEFYIKRKGRALFCILSTLIIVGAVGGIAFIFWPSPFAFLLPFFALWLIYIVLGIAFLKTDNLKDGDGEFLR